MFLPISMLNVKCHPSVLKRSESRVQIPLNISSNVVRILFHSALSCVALQVSFAMFLSKVNFVVSLTLIVVGGSEAMEVDEDLLDDVFGPETPSRIMEYYRSKMWRGVSDSVEEQVVVSCVS